jgi:hypothetical protein
MGVGGNGVEVVRGPRRRRGGCHLVVVVVDGGGVALFAQVTF